MNKTLTNWDYCQAAEKLGCEVASIKAVASVESAGGGFLPSGKVKLLFERHHFSRLTRRKFDSTHPQISSRKPGGYYGNEKEYQRFNEAFRLDPTAAMMSASWGKFQIMGFNFAVCGFSSVNAFVDAMKKSEGEQLFAFCEFVETNNLADELRRRDWAGFARGYNGKNYRINNYDGKMLAAYNKFKAEKIDCQKIADLRDEEIQLEIPAAEPTDELNDLIPPEASTSGNVAESVAANEGAENPPLPEIKTETTRKTETETEQGKQSVEVKTETPLGDAPTEEPKAWLNVEDWKPFVFRWLKRIWKWISGANLAQITAFTTAAATDPPKWFVYLGVAVGILVFSFIVAAIPSGVLLLIWYFNRKEIKEYKKLEFVTKTDPNAFNLGLEFEKK